MSDQKSNFKEEDIKIFNELNGYTENNGVDRGITAEILNNSIELILDGELTIYESEKIFMQRMLIKEKDELNKLGIETIEKALKDFSFFIKNEVPKEDHIKEKLTIEKIDYIYKNIHKSLSDKISFKVNELNIDDIRYINKIIKENKGLYENKGKKSKDLEILRNKALVCALTIGLLSNEKVINMGGPKTSLILSQIISDANIPDKKISVYSIPPVLINNDVKKLLDGGLDENNRLDVIKNLQKSIIAYNMVELPELVYEFNIPSDFMDSMKKASEGIYLSKGIEMKTDDNENENTNKKDKDDFGLK